LEFTWLVEVKMDWADNVQVLWTIHNQAALAPGKYTPVPIEQWAWWVPGRLLAFSRRVKSVVLTGTCSIIPRFFNPRCGHFTDSTISAPEKMTFLFESVGVCWKINEIYFRIYREPVLVWAGCCRVSAVYAVANRLNAPWRQYGGELILMMSSVVLQWRNGLGSSFISEGLLKFLLLYRLSVF